MEMVGCHITGFNTNLQAVGCEVNLAVYATELERNTLNDKVPHGFAGAQASSGNAIAKSMNRETIPENVALPMDEIQVGSTGAKPVLTSSRYKKGKSVKQKTSLENGALPMDKISLGFTGAEPVVPSSGDAAGESSHQQTGLENGALPTTYLDFATLQIIVFQRLAANETLLVAHSQEIQQQKVQLATQQAQIMVLQAELEAQRRKLQAVEARKTALEKWRVEHQAQVTATKEERDTKRAKRMGANVTGNDVVVLD